MQNQPSQHPRDIAVRAALADAAALAAMLTDEFVASYRGGFRDEYLGVLAGFVTDLGGVIETGREPVVQFGERRIAIRFE
jgi:hypothetical protein